MTTPPLTTPALLARLQASYVQPGAPLPGGIFVPEVGINGATGQRCDAVYAGFTSASGRILIGHELKVTRADWRHELTQLDKADTWADACHAWYVVAPSTDVVPIEELPHGWGLMVPDPRGKVRFKTLVKSEVKTGHNPPWWAVRSVMARWDTLRAEAITKRVSDGVRDGIAEYQEREEQSRRLQGGGGRMTPEAEVALRVMEAFANAGVVLSESHRTHWARKNSGEVLAPDMVKDIIPLLQQRAETERLRQTLVGPYSGLDQIERAVRQLADAVKTLATVPTPAAPIEESA